MRELFPGTHSPHLQSNKEIRYTESVTTRWPLNINSVPIDYAFRPRLRGRLTLRWLTQEFEICKEIDFFGSAYAVSVLIATHGTPMLVSIRVISRMKLLFENQAIRIISTG